MSITLTWTFPTTWTDGSAIASTEVLCATIVETSVTPPISLGAGCGAPGSKGSLTTEILAPGTYVATVTDSAGRTVGNSNTASAAIQPVAAPLSLITDLAARVNTPQKQSSWEPIY